MIDVRSMWCDKSMSCKLPAKLTLHSIGSMNWLNELAQFWNDFILQQNKNGSCLFVGGKSVYFLISKRVYSCYIAYDIYIIVAYGSIDGIKVAKLIFFKLITRKWGREAGFDDTTSFVTVCINCCRLTSLEKRLLSKLIQTIRTKKKKIYNNNIESEYIRIQWSLQVNT